MSNPVAVRAASAARLGVLLLLLLQVLATVRASTRGRGVAGISAAGRIRRGGGGSGAAKSNLTTCGDVTADAEAAGGGPALWIMPSYATSGSEFTRELVAAAMHSAVATLYRTQGCFEMVSVRRTGTAARKSTVKVSYALASGRPDAATRAKPLLVKTHFPSVAGKQDERTLWSDAGVLHDDGGRGGAGRDAAVSGSGNSSRTRTSPRRFRGIVQLVRNPGDCLLRNSARWQCTHSGDAAAVKRCRARGEAGHCEHLSGALWVQHQAYWLDLAAQHGIPWFALRYEDLLAEPRGTLRRLARFMNGGSGGGTGGARGEAEDVAAALDFESPDVKTLLGDDRPPTSSTSVLGHLMAERGCSLKAREKLHRQTAAVAHKLGYGFDAVNGTWFLQPDRWADFDGDRAGGGGSGGDGDGSDGDSDGSGGSGAAGG